MLVGSKWLTIYYWLFTYYSLQFIIVYYLTEYLIWHFSTRGIEWIRGGDQILLERGNYLGKEGKAPNEKDLVLQKSSGAEGEQGIYYLSVGGLWTLAGHHLSFIDL